MNFKKLFNKIFFGFVKGAALSAASAFAANPSLTPKELGAIALSAGVSLSFGEGANNYRKHAGKVSVSGE